MTGQPLCPELQAILLPRIDQELVGRIAPAARVVIVIEALAGLRRLQQEMARLSSHDDNYESNRRALQAAVRDLRAIISANVQ